jgi:hypothetical protein
MQKLNVNSGKNSFGVKKRHDYFKESPEDIFPG